jgi:16S rRNA (uracil1498-N3)-methyltransferase
MQRIVININQKEEGKITFNQEQYHYIFRVLRLEIDDNIIALDGVGHSWLLQIKSDHGLIVKEIIENPELPFDVTLLVALPKGNGFDDIVRCCTELGVKTIIPLETERTLLKPSANKILRWRKIAQEAAEQSERLIVPQIGEPVKFTDLFNQEISPLPPLLTEEKQDYNYYICVARGDRQNFLKSLEKGAKNIIIATGPEGGWTEKELELAIQNNFQPVSLGQRILRAVTAPICAMSIISIAAN